MENRNTYKRFNVPLDVLTDVVKIIIDNELKNEITGANENKSFIEVKVEYQNGLGLHLKAINNIESILENELYCLLQISAFTEFCIMVRSSSSLVALYSILLSFMVIFISIL